MTLANLSFELAAGTPGDASGWTWTRQPAFLFARFVTPGGSWSRFESFEFGWRMPSVDLGTQNYPFVGALVVPSSAQPLVFGSLSGTPAPFENFERQWRLPKTPAADSTHPGNETAYFVWESSLAAAFQPSGHVFEDFEAGWSIDESYVWTFAPGLLQAAVFEAHAFENFETGWKGNDTYYFTMGSLSPAAFGTPTGPLLFEDFESFKADQPVTFVLVNSAVQVAVMPSNNGQLCTFYNPGDGSLPPEINPRSTYWVSHRVLTGAGSPYFQISVVGGGLVTFTGVGSGSNFFKSDTTLFWTLTDVGI